RALNVILVLQCERRRFLRVGLAVPLLGTVAELREMVAREGHIPPEQVMGGMGGTGKGRDPLRATEVPSAVPQVILAEVSPQGFLRSLGDSEELGAAGEGAPLYAFQPPPARRPGTANPSPLAGNRGLHSLDWLGGQGLPASPGAAQPEAQHPLPSAARSSDCLHRGASSRVLLLLCNTVSDGHRLTRFGPPLVLREERGISWEQLQQSILGQLRALLRAEARAQGMGVPLFRIRLAEGMEPCTYLSPQDPHPLCHPAIDRALQLSGSGGPPHVRLMAEWDLNTKERLFGSVQGEAVEDAESVGLQQQAHRQQPSCTLDECFQLYTKEEQVRGTAG
ncbi:UBP43 hydrolase, partial [Ramphastos sulfuratus]|nr:UBP43 hydrolase [Ramphastos sulfuratus]